MHVSKVACPPVMAATWRRGVSKWQSMACHRRKYLLVTLCIPSHAPIVLIKSSCWTAAPSSTNSWHSALRHQLDCWSSEFSTVGESDWVHSVASMKEKVEFWAPPNLCQIWGARGTKNTGLFKMIVGVLTTCHTQYTWDSSICVSLYTGLFKMFVGVLTTCHTQYTSDISICAFLFNRKTLQVFVTYLTDALYVHRLWFYRHQHDNRVRSACQRWWFQWRFWFVPSVPGYTRTLSLETVHTTFEWNCQMAVVSPVWCGIAAGQLHSDNHFE